MATAGVGIPVSLLLARQENVSFGGYALTAIVALSRALFALNISIKFPLFVQFGYTRAGMLGTTLPIILVAFAALRSPQLVVGVGQGMITETFSSYSAREFRGEQSLPDPHDSWHRDRERVRFGVWL